MNRLVRVELTRLLCRRAIVILLAVGILLPTVIGVARVLETREPGGAELAQAEEQVAAELAHPRVQRDLARCEKKPEEHFGPDIPDDLEQACLDYYGISVQNYLYFERLDLATEREEGSGIAVVILLAILMMLAGTTFAGHDWASGSVSNQVLFEPRRVRVWGAKALVVTAVSGIFTVIVTTSYWLMLALVAKTRDMSLGDELLLDCLQSGWRGAAVAAGAAFAGYALTMLFRSTVGALGVLLAVSIAGGIVLAVLGISGAWNPGTNILAVINDGATYYADAPCPGEPEGTYYCSIEKTLGLGRALWFLGSGLVLFAAASITSFQRRDVP